MDRSVHGARSTERGARSVEREASSDCFADWHSKIDFHYIFVGGIRNFIMSEEASRMVQWSGIHWSVILLLDGEAVRWEDVRLVGGGCTG